MFNFEIIEEQGLSNTSIGKSQEVQEVDSNHNNNTSSSSKSSHDNLNIIIDDDFRHSKSLEEYVDKVLEKGKQLKLGGI